MTTEERRALQYRTITTYGAAVSSEKARSRNGKVLFYLRHGRSAVFRWLD